MLTRPQPRQQHDSAVWKFYRIMMGVWSVNIYLADATDCMRNPPSFFLEEEGLKSAVMEFDSVFEGELCAREKADRDVGLCHRGKTARESVIEIRSYKFVSDRRRAGGHGVKTIITHRMALSSLQR